MPTYEYECKHCGGTMDIFQSITARPLSKARCDKCDVVRPVKRLIGTGGAVLFKGGGFYQTDYRSEGYKAKAKAESGGGAAPSEAKPAESKATDASKSKPSPAPSQASPPKPDRGKKSE